MRGMSPRQAITYTAILLTLLAGLTACSPSELSFPTPAHPSPTSTLTPTFTFTPSPPTITPTPPPPACVTQPGQVEEKLLDTTIPPQAYFIYLPPCYAENTNQHYPVLYLLHGQTYTADQWIRIGAVDALNAILLSGQAQPFIIVFPDDRYWNLPAGAAFGQRLVEDLIPHIDSTYRTLPDRSHRAIGGLSRGGGWALRLGFTRWDLFSVIGLHSPAILQGDASQVAKWIAAIPPDNRPTIFMDIGDKDQEWRMAVALEAQFNESGLVHEWRFYSGAHTEEYWSAHVEEYIRWYAEQWNNLPQP
jgi:enterochelin esterase-like enzyme